ncbi:hypothetical protein Tco_1134131 [Tanacetum coccineum]
MRVQQLWGENSAHTANKEPPSLTEREKADTDTNEAVKKEPAKEPEKEKAEEEPARASRAITISTVIRITRPNRELEMIGSSSRVQLTDTTLEFLIPQPTRTDEGKGIATDDTKEPTRKLMPASRKVHQDPDEPIRVPYEIHGKTYQLINDEIQAHLDKEEKIKKAVEEAKLLPMSKPDLIKVVHKEASNVRIDPKVLLSLKGGQEFKEIQDSDTTC